MHFWKRLQRKLFALQSGPAHRVIFYYYGEDPTYLEDAFVTVFRNGVVEILHRNEHVSTHAQNVEILWKGRGSSSHHKGRHLSLIKNETTKN